MATAAFVAAVFSFLFGAEKRNYRRVADTSAIFFPVFRQNHYRFILCSVEHMFDYYNLFVFQWSQSNLFINSAKAS